MKAANRKAVITRNKKTGEFHFSLTGDNGKKVGTGETYKRKTTMIQTIKKYFPGFTLHDLTLMIVFVVIGICASSQAQVATLNGSASSDADGRIVHYKWSPVAPIPMACKIANDTMAITTVIPANNLQWIPGVYTFQLLVTDDKGGTGTATTKITVTTSIPQVEAGNPQTIQLPGTATLKAVATVTLGIVKTWAWSQTAGPNQATFNRKDTSTVIVSGMIPGIYMFKISITDNYGGSTQDSVLVNVLATNALPHADAGSDKSITLPVNSVSIGGNGDQPAGAVAIQWKKISGPAGDIIQSPTAAQTKISGLSKGQFVYQKIVTNAAGQFSTDNVTIIVRKCSWLMALFGRC